MHEGRFMREVPSGQEPSDDAVIERIEKNIAAVLESDTAKRKEGLFAFENLGKLFTFDGAVRLPRISDAHYREFFERPGRQVRERGSAVLRGERYLCALDNNIGLPHKVKILREDFDEAIDFLARDAIEKATKEHTLLRLAALDYVKNSAVTLLNGLISSEKFGNLRLDDKEYQQTRVMALRIAALSVQAQYAFMLGDRHGSRACLRDLAMRRTELERVGQHLIADSKRLEELGLTPAQRPVLTRPELGHPLVIGAACLHTIERRADNVPDTIVALPTGGTEYALALQYGFKRLTNKDPRLILLPISLHSTRRKDVQDPYDIAGVASDIVGSREGGKNMGTYLRSQTPSFQHQRVLIVDDNASSGRTLQLTADTITMMFGPKSIDTSIAEIDTVRTHLRSDELSAGPHARETMSVVTDEAAKDVVGRLPVSKFIEPRADSLRKAAEIRRVRRFYEEKRTRAPVDEIIKRISLRNVTSGLLHELFSAGDRSGNIYSFRETDPATNRKRPSFLSNFYPAPVSFRVPKYENGKNGSFGPALTYPTVEHAYQAAKFPKEVARAIPPEMFAALNDHMAKRYSERGQNPWIPINSGEELLAAFASDTYSPGRIKVMSDFLRDQGHIRADWFDLRLKVMVGLLLEKFDKHPELREKLLATGDSYLVEGTTWGDSYWGWSVRPGTKTIGWNQIKNGYGANMLGFALMEVRDYLRRAA